jgi:hypothetical protein
MKYCSIRAYKYSRMQRLFKQNQLSLSRLEYPNLCTIIRDTNKFGIYPPQTIFLGEFQRIIGAVKESRDDL